MCSCAGDDSRGIQWLQGNTRPGLLSWAFHLPWKRRKIGRFALGVRFPSNEMELQSVPKCSNISHTLRGGGSKSLLWCFSGLMLYQTLTLAWQPYQSATHALSYFSPFCAYFTIYSVILSPLKKKNRVTRQVDYFHIHKCLLVCAW